MVSYLQTIVHSKCAQIDNSSLECSLTACTPNHTQLVKNSQQSCPALLMCFGVADYDLLATPLWGCKIDLPRGVGSRGKSGRKVFVARAKPGWEHR
eukprot:3311375-Amphidinium_carterae.1